MINKNIHGLKVNGIELKLSLYADDIIALIGDYKSANHLFNLLNDFRDCSGLKIDICKTEEM